MNLKMSRLAVKPVLLALIAILDATPALAADVTTIAGRGLPRFSGDGGPATSAELNGPDDVAVAADGTVYVADAFNLRIRRISPGGVISTIAGNGTYGDAGDGGQATAAQLGSIAAIALSPADDVLYIADDGTNRVRRVDLASGVITTFAGRGLDYLGHTGNGGPATSASIAMPAGIAVDPAGNVYFSESTFWCTVRKVDIATQVITRVAGSGSYLPGACASDGDGGDALAAQLDLPGSLATDAAGNLFLVEIGTDTVRRIDAVTHIITTIAGGGVTTPGFGDATTMDLGDIHGLAIDGADDLYVSNFNRVLKVDLGTNILSVHAGSGATGFSGDGGNALAATFNGIWAIEARGSKVFIADQINNRIRAVVPPPLPDDLVIELATSQALLDSLNTVAGSILMVNVDGREYLLIPNATSVGLDVTLTGNDQLLVVDLGALQSVGGSITISGNLVMQSVDLSSLATVDGSLTVTDNPALNAILISGVTSIGGDVTVVGTAATVIDMSALTTVSGDLTVADNTAADIIDMSALTSVVGDATVTGNTGAEVIDMTSLTTVGGDVDLSGNTSMTTVDMSALTTVGEDVVIGGDTAATTIDMSSVTSAGSVLISGNTAATLVDMSGLTTVGMDVVIVDNGDATVDMSASTAVGGDVTVETTGTGTFDMGTGTVAGDVTVDATGYTDMSGNTPGGDLDLTATRAEAVMHLQIPAASFTTPVSFSVTRVDPVALVPESGLNASGSPATIDPIAAYQFDFEVPTLDRDAELSFDIGLAQLDAATRTNLLDALAAGTATLVTKGDGAGSRFQAFPVCASAETPTAGGCVRVEAFDANGRPTSGTPARVRFSGVIGHFSTWAVATVTGVTQVNRTVICSALGGHRLPDVHLFSFIGGKGEEVTVKLAANPAGIFTPGRAALTLFGINLLRLDATVLPNTITATLPRTGNYFVTVAELLLKTGKFKGDYCVSVESTQNAWQTLHRM
jgi:sugar lactone lactonase YvrE